MQALECNSEEKKRKTRSDDLFITCASNTSSSKGSSPSLSGSSSSTSPLRRPSSSSGATRATPTTTTTSTPNEEPVAGPSNKAAEFHLDVFDSGSSSSLDDCCGSDNSSFDDNSFEDKGFVDKSFDKEKEGEAGEEEEERRSFSKTRLTRRKKKLSNATTSSGKRSKKALHRHTHAKRNSNSCERKKKNDDEDHDQDKDDEKIAKDEILDRTKALDEDEEASIIASVPNTNDTNSGSAEPPESACPSESEDTTMDGSNGQSIGLEDVDNDSNGDNRNDEEEWPNNNDNDKIASSSSTTTSANSPLNDCCDVDEIVRDHDNFGTHENEDDENSMDNYDTHNVLNDEDDSTNDTSDNNRLHRSKSEIHTIEEKTVAFDEQCKINFDKHYSGSSKSLDGLDTTELRDTQSIPLFPLASSSKRKCDSIAQSSHVVDNVDDHSGVSELKKPCLNSDNGSSDAAFLRIKTSSKNQQTHVYALSEVKLENLTSTHSSSLPSSDLTSQTMSSGPHTIQNIAEATAVGNEFPSSSSSDDGSGMNAEISQWLTSFSRWSHTSKLSAIDQLISLCQPSQVRHMMSVIEPQFQRDFISLLPKELALYVLSFLTPQDLLRAAQTCRYWRILCEDNLLWREKCNEAGLDQSVSDVMRSRLAKVSSPAFIYSPFKASLLCQHNVEMNWRVKPIKTPKVLKGHDDHVITCLQFCDDKVVSGSDDNTLKVWSVISGKCLRTLVGHTGGVWSSQMEGNTVVSGSTDRTLKVWDTQTGDCVHTLYGHTSTVRCMHLHKSRVVSGSRDATLRMWDILSGECLHVLLGHVAAVRCVQYNGQLVVSGAYDYTVKVWNPEREECLHTLSGHTNRVYSLQFDGVHVVSGSLDTSIRVWDVQTGACKHALMGHQSLTSGMELRNNILVSGNADSTVKVWDIVTGQCLQTLSGPNKHQSAVTCLQFNSKFVITSSDDGTVKLWDVNTGQFLRDLVSLDSGGSGGVVWRIRANSTKLVCAVGSRNGTEETKLLVLDFEADTLPHIAVNSTANSSF